MADEQSSVEIAPTIVISSSEGSGNEGHENSGDEAHSVGGEGDSGSTLEDVAISQSDQVAIATIEAERDITLGAIHSDVERDRIELESRRVEAITETNEELEACRRELAVLTAKVETLESLLIPPPQLEEEVTEILEIAPETDLIQPSIAAPTAEQSPENLEESLGEETEEVIPNRVRKFIAI